MELNYILGEKYLEHKVFKKLIEYIEFYKGLSFQVMGYVKFGTKGVTNLDTYIFSSMQGTLESIKDVLTKGRINDAYALLRKYYDSTIINVYSNLYLDDNLNIENFIVAKIQNWIEGKEKIPEYRVMSKYIKDSPRLLAITTLLQKDKKYRKIRNRCNDHTHYNFYYNLLLNDNEIHLENRLKILDAFSHDLDDVFIQHFAYIFYLNDYYMMASNYTDSIEMGYTPEEDSNYWVAPYIQEIFENVIKINRPDIAEEIKGHSMMQLK